MYVYCIRCGSDVKGEMPYWSMAVYFVRVAGPKKQVPWSLGWASKDGELRYGLVPSVGSPLGGLTRPWSL